MPYFRHEIDEILGIGTQIPLGFQTNALVRNTNLQTVAYIVWAVVASGQCVKVFCLGLLQAPQRLLVRNETARFRKTQHMPIETFGEIRPYALKRFMELF